jgi:hypothetical protein
MQIYTCLSIDVVLGMPLTLKLETPTNRFTSARGYRVASSQAVPATRLTSSLFIDETKAPRAQEGLDFGSNVYDLYQLSNTLSTTYLGINPQSHPLFQ